MYNNKSKKKQYKYNILKGGKFLGKGSYGCVIKPALKCNKISLFSKNSKKNTKNSDNISKIVLVNDSSNDGILDEIAINKKLKQIDPKMKYFITIKEHCSVQNVPKDRSNIVKVKYKKKKNNTYNSQYNNSNSSNTYTDLYNKTKYTKIQNKTLDKKYCPVDLSKNPINIIMPYGGYDLFNIIVSIDDSILDNKIKNYNLINKIIKKQQYIANILFINFKKYFKDMLYGLYKMHTNRIVNRDIKPENIMVKYDTHNIRKNIISIRYIDFGLSEQLTDEFCSHYSNITLNGTTDYIALEIFIIYNITAHFLNGETDDKYIKEKIYDDLTDHEAKLKSLEIDTTKFEDIKNKLYDDIKKMYSNKELLLSKYFGVDKILNGYLQKSDIYGLGITMFTFISRYINIKQHSAHSIHKQLYDLLYHMIDFNPETRYNVIQCLQHPYFNS